MGQHLGIEIQQQRFSARDHARFKAALQDSLTALERVLARPDFGRGEPSIGAELELFLIDPQGRPLALSEAVIAAIDNNLVTPEMGAFDIELCTDPTPLAGRPFSLLRARMEDTLRAIARGAAQCGARVVPISILPTFRRSDFHPGAITDRPRYRALAAGLRKLRAAPFHVCIEGDDKLELETDNAAMEAANTAFQLHLRVEPRAFASHFNAATMLTAPVLAAAGNSPTFLGHQLWHETRVALFKQAGDDRPPDDDESAWRKPARIGLGNGWVREGALELFAESVALHEPLLPVCSDEDVRTCVETGGVPQLAELRLHHGTVWNWNRPVYDPAAGGHLRIELRALPAGPSLDDMLANGSFLLGATLALAPEMGALLPAFPFELAVHNFERAAQHGLDAEFFWPLAPGSAPERIGARDLIARLLPRAREGLLHAGVAKVEASYFLEIIAERSERGVTGAVWQRRTLAALEAGGLTRERAASVMLERYVALCESGLPVHRWPLSEA